MGNYQNETGCLYFSSFAAWFTNIMKINSFLAHNSLSCMVLNSVEYWCLDGVARWFGETSWLTSISFQVVKKQIGQIFFQKKGFNLDCHNNLKRRLTSCRSYVIFFLTYCSVTTKTSCSFKHLNLTSPGLMCI